MRTEAEQVATPRGLRSQSSASDIISSSGRSFLGGVLPQASPDPAYIAQSAAEHLTSTELDRSVAISDTALNLVNGFLDQVLYNILSVSKATSLDALRQAVPRLLRPRLGQAAVSAADEELSDYIREEDPENLQQPPKLVKPSDFDLELAWKLARLRCMVYARLGDMEEEDEEEFLESERLEEHTHGSPMSVVPMSAIFLTSVLEFLGEQALCNAAQHAEKRHNARASKQASDSLDSHPEDAAVVIDQLDMLQLGREGPLSRLWRSWRRESRASDSFASRPMTPRSVMSPTLTDATHSRKASHASPTHIIPEEDSPRSQPVTPSQIPLPMREADIDEIEVPGLAPDYDDDSNGARSNRPVPGPRRPSSLCIIPGDFPSSPVPQSPTSPTVPTRSPFRPSYSRKRSHSLPGASEKVPFDFERPWKRDTMASTATWQTETVGDLTEGDEDEQPQPDQSGLPSTQNSRPGTQHSQRAGAINGAAVAAIAGALGVEAARSRKNRERQEGARYELPRNRSAAEEIMGVAHSAPAPRNSDTRASITEPRDFEALHIPRDVENDESRDPEDLALSSGDEGNAAQARQPRDSGFGAGGSHASHAVPTSPVSPRRNREAAVYENSIVSSPREPSTEVGEDRNSASNRPRTQESVTFEPSALAHASAQDGDTRNARHSDLPIQKPEEFESDGTSVLANGAWTSSIPTRMSSREQPHHGPTMSKSSQYSHHSKTSSASSRLLTFTRDQNGHPLKEQRAGFNEQNQSIHSRQGSANTQKVIPASPGSNLAARRAHLRVRADSEEDAARTKSLEILLKSDETLHYTLTPESARAEEFPHSPTKPRTETQDLADFFRNTAPPGEAQPSGHSRSAKHSLSGLRSHPPEPYQQSTIAGAPKADQTHPAELSAMPNSPRKAVQQPRDPRPERNTTRDLADYVRSTGPTNETQLPKALSPPAEDTAKEAITATRPGVVPQVDDTDRSANTRPGNRLKFQARDARPLPGSETADLIDFIRQGPPRVVGDHRIDRKVAPFRTTMDSDDLQALAPPSELPARDSVGSTHDSTATKSVQESTNSRTALLESSRQGNFRSVAPPINHDVKRQVIPEQGGLPQRTRRRVKDPYAIDVSDDEELEEQPSKPRPRNEEESLIDFLRNTAPPPGNGTQPILAAGARVQEKTDLNRSVSNSKLRDILIRDGSSKNGVMVSTNGVRDEAAQMRQRAADRQGAIGNKPKPKFQAREAKTSVTSTSDLADFLSNSGPTQSSHSLPDGSNTDSRFVRSEVKEQAGFMKFFSRKASVRR